MDLSNFLVEHDFLHIGQKAMLLNARLIQLGDEEDSILIAIEDITERKKAERARGSLVTRPRKRSGHHTFFLNLAN